MCQGSLTEVIYYHANMNNSFQECLPIDGLIEEDSDTIEAQDCRVSSFVADIASCNYVGDIIL